jgi:hypothetical protein
MATRFEDMFVVCPHTKFHKLSYSFALVITMKLELNIDFVGSTGCLYTVVMVITKVT